MIVSIPVRLRTATLDLSVAPELPHQLGEVHSLDGEWKRRAICDGLNFFPQAGPGVDIVRVTNRLKVMCSFCPVQPQCLAYAVLANEQDGIWGGMIQDDFALIRKELKARDLLVPVSNYKPRLTSWA